MKKAYIDAWYFIYLYVDQLTGSQKKVNWINIDSAFGLLPVRHQAMTSGSANSLSTEPLRDWLPLTFQSK